MDADFSTTLPEVESRPDLSIDPEQVRLLRSAVLRANLLRLACRGMTAKEAAERLKISVETARYIYRDRQFRTDVLRQVDKAFEDVDSTFKSKKKDLHERISEQAERSFDDLCQMLDNPDLQPSIRMRINQDFLNRSHDTAQVQARSTKLNPEELARAAETARQMDNVISIAVRKEKAS